MNELSIKEKAKRYDEALEIAKKNYISAQNLCKYSKIGILNVFKNTLEKIFPELKESEDERIRKAIIEHFSRGKEVEFPELEEKYNTWIAWLEKQGEKPQGKSALEAINEEKIDNQNCVKPTDKVKSKFNVGDWVIDKQDIVHQIANVIENVTNHTYGYDIVGGGYFNDNTEGVRLWTIQDTKDGDVLAAEDKNFTTPFIVIYKSLGDTVYKGLRDNITFNSHCFIGFNGNFYKGEEGHATENVHPATKEQRDFLFQKMKEAGYEWDAEKKEPKKIEEKLEEKLTIPSLKDFQEAFELKAKQYDIELPNRGYDIHAMCKELYSLLIKQKPTWSKEDDRIYYSLLADIRTRQDNSTNTLEAYYNEQIEWLKSLKERIGEIKL